MLRRLVSMWQECSPAGRQGEFNMSWILSERPTCGRGILSALRGREKFVIATGDSLVETDDEGVLDHVMAATGGDHRDHSMLLRRLRSAQREFGPQSAVTFPAGDRFPSIQEALTHLEE